MVADVQVTLVQPDMNKKITCKTVSSPFTNALAKNLQGTVSITIGPRFFGFVIVIQLPLQVGMSDRFGVYICRKTAEFHWKRAKEGSILAQADFSSKPGPIYIYWMCWMEE